VFNITKRRSHFRNIWLIANVTGAPPDHVAAYAAGLWRVAAGSLQLVSAEDVERATLQE